jgi:hypothetical protein
MYNSNATFASIKHLLGDSLRRIIVCTGTPFLANKLNSKFANLLFLTNPCSSLFTLCSRLDQPYFNEDPAHWLRRFSAKSLSPDTHNDLSDFLKHRFLRRTLDQVRAANNIPIPILHSIVIPSNVFPDEQSILSQYESNSIDSVRQSHRHNQKTNPLQILNSLRPLVELNPLLAHKHNSLLNDAKASILKNDPHFFSKFPSPQKADSALTALAHDAIAPTLPDILNNFSDYPSQKELNLSAILRYITLSLKHKLLLVAKFSFSHLRILAIANRLNIPIFHYHADLSPNARQALIDAFRDCPHPAIFLSSPQLLSRGVNLQCAPHVVLLTSEYNPASTDQTIGRINRLSSPFPHLFHWHFTIAASFDTWVSTAIVHLRKVTPSSKFFEQNSRVLNASTALASAHHDQDRNARFSNLALSFCDEMPTLARSRKVGVVVDLRAILEPFAPFFAAPSANAN